MSKDIIKDEELQAVQVYINHIDNRMVDCACGKRDCKIGLNFDTMEDGTEVMLLTDKFGNEHGMRLDKDTAREIVDNLSNLL